MATRTRELGTKVSMYNCYGVKENTFVLTDEVEG